MKTDSVWDKDWLFGKNLKIETDFDFFEPNWAWVRDWPLEEIKTSDETDFLKIDWLWARDWLS